MRSLPTLRDTYTYARKAPCGQLGNFQHRSEGTAPDVSISRVTGNRRQLSSHRAARALSSRSTQLESYQSTRSRCSRVNSTCFTRGGAEMIRVLSQRRHGHSLQWTTKDCAAGSCAHRKTNHALSVLPLPLSPSRSLVLLSCRSGRNSQIKNPTHLTRMTLLTARGTFLPL